MCGTFWSGFLANLLSDLIVAVGLGAPLAWFLNKKLSQLTLREERRQARRADLEKAKRYVDLLKEEVEEVLKVLPGVTNAFDKTGYGTMFRIPTPVWDVLQPSGDLPRLLDADLLESLSEFYDHITYAKREMDWVVRAWLVPEPQTVPGFDQKLDAAVKLTSDALHEGAKSGSTLPGDLGTELQRLGRRLDSL
jgi:hypothetical protein